LKEVLADDGAERAVFEAGIEAGEMSRLPSPVTTQRVKARMERLSHDVTRVDGDFAAIADDNDATVGGESFMSAERLRWRAFRGRRLLRDASGFHDFVGVTGFGVIEGVVSAFFAGLARGPSLCGRAKNSEPHRTSELYCRLCDAAALRRNQNGFEARASAELCSAKYAVPYGT